LYNLATVLSTYELRTDRGYGPADSLDVSLLDNEE
jgi:hypothetical protein